MVYKVVFLEEAFEDLNRIGKFIASDNPVKAFEWLDFLQDSTRKLADNPRLGKPYKRKYHQLIVDRGYKIFYRVSDQEKSIFVVAIYEPQFPEKLMRI